MGFSGVITLITVSGVIALPTVDGRNPAPVDRVTYPIIYRVSYIPGGCLRFQPSTV